jgi:hypothetical protein
MRCIVFLRSVRTEAVFCPYYSRREAVNARDFFPLVSAPRPVRLAAPREPVDRERRIGYNEAVFRAG